ncbi:NINE protein [Actinomyces bowdenii]|uniref:TM2 domain-containing protein n=1 Tax=Actinomyces bowdenii TaxID=131109 RepID=UPI00214CAEF3|nr:NINE protein [Actinomyces bowdenii]MCR2051496.1 NINE protein [Actinomyces bowdenii]
MTSPSTPSPQQEPWTEAYPVQEVTSAYPVLLAGGGAQDHAPSAPSMALDGPGPSSGYAPSALVPFEPAPYAAAPLGGAGLPHQGAGYAVAYGPPSAAPYAGAYGPALGVPYAVPYAGPGAYGAPVAPKSKVVVFVLAFFLGVLGVHNFYLGRTGKGVAQLLITLISAGFLALPAWIWAFIEAICVCAAQPGSYPWGVDAHGIPVT